MYSWRCGLKMLSWQMVSLSLGKLEQVNTSTYLWLSSIPDSTPLSFPSLSLRVPPGPDTIYTSESPVHVNCLEIEDHSGFLGYRCRDDLFRWDWNTGPRFSSFSYCNMNDGWCSQPCRSFMIYPDIEKYLKIFYRKKIRK